MTTGQFKRVEEFMRAHGEPGVPDKAHSYRVLHLALGLAEGKEVNWDVLILACLLHDVGRAGLGGGAGHAAVGAEMAYTFLLEEKWDENIANHVKKCIKTHSRKGFDKPASREAKILYDADKLDMSGAVGCARMTALGALAGEEFYHTGESGVPSTEEDAEPTLFERVAKRIGKKGGYYTKAGKRMGEKRDAEFAALFERMQKEVNKPAKNGRKILDKILEFDEEKGE